MNVMYDVLCDPYHFADYCESAPSISLNAHSSACPRLPLSTDLLEKVTGLFGYHHVLNLAVQLVDCFS